jgi:hypothetical protein
VSTQVRLNSWGSKSRLRLIELVHINGIRQALQLEPTDDRLLIRTNNYLIDDSIFHRVLQRGYENPARSRVKMFQWFVKDHESG